jgi:hypothetical protein
MTLTVTSKTSIPPSSPYWREVGGLEVLDVFFCHVSDFFLYCVILLLYICIYIYIYIFWGPLMVAQWLRYCATNRKVAGSIPDGVIGISH